jgi:hypothetical protein
MIKVFELKVKSEWMNGSIIFNSLDDAMECLKTDLEDETEASIKLKVLEMTEEQYNALPEFEGW